MRHLRGKFGSNAIQKSKTPAHQVQPQTSLAQDPSNHSLVSAAPAPEVVSPLAKSSKIQDSSARSATSQATIPVTTSLSTQQATTATAKIKSTTKSKVPVATTTTTACPAELDSTTSSAQKAKERLQTLQGKSSCPQELTNKSFTASVLKSAQSARERLKTLSEQEGKFKSRAQDTLTADKGKIEATSCATATTPHIDHIAVDTKATLTRSSAATTTTTSSSTSQSISDSAELTKIILASEEGQATSAIQTDSAICFEQNLTKDQDEFYLRQESTPQEMLASYEDNVVDGAKSEHMIEHEEATEAESESKMIYPVVVYTPQELEQAQKSGAKRILVKGQLAAKLETALKSIRSMSAASLNTLALVISGAALLAPFTGGVSLGAAGTVMGTLGAAVTAAAIAAISAIGLSLVIAVLKGYDEVKIGGGGLELVIKKHKDKVQDFPSAKAELSDSGASLDRRELETQEGRQEEKGVQASQDNSEQAQQDKGP